MRKSIALLGLSAPLALAACANTKASGFGARSGPNEFAVARAAPLTVPPDFSLRPPKPGAPRPQEASASAQALVAMFGGTARTSAGQEALLDQAGGDPDIAGVRSEVGSPGTDVVDKGGTTRSILSAPASAGQEATASTPQAATPR